MTTCVRMHVRVRVQEEGGKQRTCCTGHQSKDSSALTRKMMPSACLRSAVETISAISIVGPSIISSPASKVSEPESVLVSERVCVRVKERDQEYRQRVPLRAQESNLCDLNPRSICHVGPGPYRSQYTNVSVSECVCMRARAHVRVCERKSVLQDTQSRGKTSLFP